MRKIIVFVALIGVSIFLAGCTQEGNQGGGIANKIEIKTGSDDGGVVALTDMLPDASFGVINGGSDQPFMIGLFVSGGGDNLTGRGIYRFDISGYENKNFTFHVKCIEKHGNPGGLEVYLTNDSGPLEISPTNMRDVSEIWNLIKTGEKIDIVTPSPGQWISVSIPSSLVKSKVTDSGYITIMLKLEDENLSSNQDYYSFSTSEYAKGTCEPYLEIQ